MSRKGIRHPELHEAGKRAVQPPHPLRATSSAMAGPVQRVAYVVGVETTGWGASYRTDDGRAREECQVIATLSDGSTRTVDAEMVYEKNEREHLVEMMTRGKGSEREVMQARNILLRRCRALEIARGTLQRMCGPLVAGAAHAG